METSYETCRLHSHREIGTCPKQTIPMQVSVDYSTDTGKTGNSSYECSGNYSSSTTHLNLSGNRKKNADEKK